MTDESGRPVDLEELREDVAPITAETVAAEDAAAIDEANARDDEEFAEELALADVPTGTAPSLRSSARVDLATAPRANTFAAAMVRCGTVTLLSPARQIDPDHRSRWSDSSR